ncbi:MAG TPA: TolC family outer membrane protein [Devosia sp.]|nr:TolC family outer membrane protein [Devosia sp.]
MIGRPAGLLSLRRLVLPSLVALAAACLPAAAHAMSLNQAIAIALDSNPQIGQAIADREATEFELKQALGLYAPTLDATASTGAERLDNPTRRSVGLQDHTLLPTQVTLEANYNLLDGGYRQAATNQQASRVDSASFKVLERSEFIGLEVARQYFQVLLQMSVLRLAEQNVTFHQQALDKVAQAIKSGQLTEADRQQAEERLAEARTKVSTAEDALQSAQISFNTLVGTTLNGAVLPRAVPRSALPPNLATALGRAREHNPKLKIAQADLDAASQVVQKSKSALAPTLALNGVAQAGNDIDGSEDYTTDLQANLSLKWSLFDGGIKSAQVQADARRETETALAQQQTMRDVDESVRTSWEEMTNQGSLASQYKNQLDASNSLVSAYQDQFTIGQRSLLDVLDSQNTRFNVQVLYQTALFSERFAEYRLLAAEGGMLNYLHVSPPKQSEAYARPMVGTPPADSYQPRRLEKIDLSDAVDLTKLVN